ncbi:MAG TPA: cysteine hydrolase [Rhizomicrobium sp.]|jgi:ureidoacrylate peracid hydrolase
MGERLLPEWIARGRTALLVIDMQTDFASRDGAAGLAGHDLSAVPPALGNAARLTASARAAGVPVIFVRLETSPENDSPAWAERARRHGQSPEQALALCRAGTRGADLVLVPALAGDLVVTKHRYSAFMGTSLDAVLKERGIDTLVACGLTTECCVDSTVRDAFHRDYHVFLVGDACASYDSTLHDATLRSLDLNFAIVIRTEEAVAAWI